jgi:hypothetical protein
MYPSEIGIYLAHMTSILNECYINRYNEQISKNIHVEHFSIWRRIQVRNEESS